METNCIEKLEMYRQESIESLRYARFLQEAILQDPEGLSAIFPQSFIFNSPKNIVSGDFYWFKKTEDYMLLACADCTGHGTPGAMLTVMGANKLHEITRSKRIRPTSRILDKLNKVIYNALGKGLGTKIMCDGMDMSLFSLDFNTNILEYAGANNSIYIIRDGVLTELTADRKSIGESLKQGRYNNKIFHVKAGDMVYGFSDGYKDQFGGDKNKKFGSRNFIDLLLTIHWLPADQQKDILKARLEMWKGKMEQTDDVLVIGIKIP